MIIISSQLPRPSFCGWFCLWTLEIIVEEWWTKMNFPMEHGSMEDGEMRKAKNHEDW